MRQCCTITLDLGDVCPLCGTVCSEANPMAPETVAPTYGQPPIGFKVPKGFRFRPEHAAEKAGMAEQRVRRLHRQNGTERRRPSKKRQANRGKKVNPYGRTPIFA